LKVIIAPNALKDSLSAIDAAKAIRTGILQSDPQHETVCIPIADGGDGLLLVLKHALNGEWKTLNVQGPLGRPVQASFLYCENKSLAIIELASAAGLALLEEHEYDIRAASTYGVGQLINAALALNINHLILGIGGSATTDGAMGVASALGVKFFDRDEKVLKSCANNLNKINRIDTSQVNKKLGSVKFDIVCDVSNPLLGVQGAAAVFAPQKGADAEDIIFLEEGLAHFADILQVSQHMDVREIEGGGAAGGVGAGLKALFNANLCKGAELVLDLLAFEDQIKNADLLITSEGKLDSQTAYGKAPFVAAKMAKKYQIPAFAIVGQADEGCLRNLPVFDGIYTLTSTNITSEYAITHASELMQHMAAKLMLDICSEMRS